jgi:hypothetical protein
MKLKLGILLTICVFVSVTAVVAAGFDDDFTGQTIRVDYYHTGTAHEEHLTLDRARIEGPWPGSRSLLVDDSNLGKYMVEVVDLATNRLLYSRGFASIYGEWETTGEARDGTWRTIQEAVVLPEPRRSFQLRIRKRQADQSFNEIWAITLDPRSRFVDRAPVPSRQVWTVLEHGDPAVKVDLLILGDGYTQDEMKTFHQDVTRLTEALFHYEPFAGHKQAFNVRAIDTPALASGISRPRSGVFHDTPLGARYNAFDSERYILSMEDRKWRDVAAAAPSDFVLILVNERKYGGGGIYNLYSTAAASSSYSPYLVVHEFAHHFAGLADEYFTSPTAYEEFNDVKTEPWEMNATALLAPQNPKWASFITPGTPVPTPWDKDEYESTSRASQERRRKLREAGASEETLEALFDEERQVFTRMLADQEYSGTIGVFEGAMYESLGLYRPATDCIMFTRDDVGFCAVCAAAIERVIELYTH